MTKIAVITGGTGVLGSAVAKCFSQLEYTVHVTAQDDEARERYSGPGTATVVDLGDLRATRRFIRGLGSVDAAAICAGGFAMEPLADLTPDVYDSQLDINLRTAMYTIAALAPVLAHPSGVVFVGSQAYEGAAGKAVYAASKAGVVSLMKTAALELKSAGVRVNAVLPDTIDTPANRRAMPDADFESWAKPEEIARVIAFLCSENARVVTGNVLRVGR